MLNVTPDFPVRASSTVVEIFFVAFENPYPATPDNTAVSVAVNVFPFISASYVIPLASSLNITL